LSALLISQAGPAAAAPDGAAIFAARCAQCHQADAMGADGLAPALAGPLKAYAGSDIGRQYLSQILVSGMAGRVESQGRVIVGMMPRFADDLNDADMAAVLNYVLAKFNDVPGAPITVGAVAAARARHPSPKDTHQLRAAVVTAAK
jgi:mono/diheme cytochrome c family protein